MSRSCIVVNRELTRSLRGTHKGEEKVHELGARGGKPQWNAASDPSRRTALQFPHILARRLVKAVTHHKLDHNEGRLFHVEMDRTDSMRSSISELKAFHLAVTANRNETIRHLNIKRGEDLRREPLASCVTVPH